MNERQEKTNEEKMRVGIRKTLQMRVAAKCSERRCDIIWTTVIVEHIHRNRSRVVKEDEASSVCRGGFYAYKERWINQLYDA